MKFTAIIVSILLVISLSLSILTGCQRIGEGKTREEPELNVEVLADEYEQTITLINNVILMVQNDDDITMYDAMEILIYFNDNRIEPTQKLTIELNDMIDELISLGVSYFTSFNEESKSEIKIEIIELLNKFEEKCIEIERTIEMEGLNV